jgi:hypothetical protein
LENRVEALALLDRRLADGFGLFKGHRVPLADQRGVAKDDQARSRPEFEMAEPQLLVDQAECLVDRDALLRPDLDVRKGEELQDLIFAAPDAAELILRPAAGRRSDDLAVGGALAGPAARLEILFENFDGRAVVALVFQFLAQSQAPGFGCFGDFGVLVDVALSAGLDAASRAAMRLRKVSFSSRAAAAMAFTASNSSRLTKSIPPTHSRIFSRIDPSASRPIPAIVPATPFIIFTRSSNIRFWDCMSTSLDRECQASP